MNDILQRAGITLFSYEPGQRRGPCPKCNKGPRDDALSVNIDDDGAIWQCFRCGWKGGGTNAGTTHEREPQRRPHRDEPKPATLEPEHRKLWRECREITPGCIAGRYLAGRCCASPSNDVRWHSDIWHPFERKEIPALVALITDLISGESLSLHFTFLARDGSGKAPIERQRLYLAGHRKQGGVVRLHEDAEVDQGLIIGEGLETCLSYALEFRPIWACLDAGNVASFPVLPGIEGLTVLIDHDPAGQAAFEKVRGRYQAAGRDVIGIRAPSAGQDINDVVTT